MPAQIRRFSLPTAPQTALLALFFLAVVFRVYFRTGYYVGYISDLATLSDRWHRVAIGQVIYRDFDCPTPPLSYFVQGVLLRVFGFTLSVMRWYAAVQAGVMILIGISLLRRFFSLSFAASLFYGGILGLAWSAPVMVGFPWYDTDANFFTLLAAAALLALWGKSSGAWSFLFGFFCSLVFWCKQDLGAAAIILGGGAFFIQWAGLRSRDWKSLGFYLAGAAAPFLAFSSYFIWTGTWHKAWYWMVEQAILFRWSAGGTGFFGKIEMTVFGPRSQVGKLLLLTYAAAAALSLWIRNRAPAGARQALLRNAVVAVFSGGVFYAGFLSHDASHHELLQPCLVLAAGCLAAALTRWYWAKKAVEAWVVLLIMLSLKYTQPPLNQALSRSWGLLENKAFGGLHVSVSEADWINSITNYVERHVPREQSFFIVPFDRSPGIYMATRRLPPQPATCLIDTQVDEAKMVAGLENNKVDWIFLLPEKATAGFAGLKVVEQYVRGRFSRAESLGHGVEVWRRKT